MALIKALEGRTVHQIQSGQVIIDLCSVVKELVENSLDAGASSIEVRFRNHGLDSVEVQDNGVGISPDDFETVALKHHTSKLSGFEGLSSLQTFGFRGEALSSLCAMSTFHITTAQAHEAPKGTRLDFELSGKVKNTQVVASQQGTTVTVEDLFIGLPVRRRELDKNIKREYAKVLVLLQAYACVSSQARIAVSNSIVKGRKTMVFDTKAGQSTRDNIANVFGSKVLPGLVDMDLNFETQPTKSLFQMSEPESKKVRLLGHVSKPIFGEGRQAPDRQMLFVNARPCSLPQIARVFNEVYKSYNVSQSPFVFANIILDTHAYDVNVSPDKRTILLHEQSALLESIRTSLTELFDNQDHLMPQSQKVGQRMPAYKQLTISREASLDCGPSTSDKSIDPLKHSVTEVESEESSALTGSEDESVRPGLIEEFVGRDSRNRARQSANDGHKESRVSSKAKEELVKRLGKMQDTKDIVEEQDDRISQAEPCTVFENISTPVEDINLRIAEQQEGVRRESFSRQSPTNKILPKEKQDQVQELPKTSAGICEPTNHNAVQNAFDRMRPRRSSPEVATITIESKTTTSLLGSSNLSGHRGPKMESRTDFRPQTLQVQPANENFTSSMRSFAAPGSELLQKVSKPRSKVHLARDYSPVQRDIQHTDASTSPEQSDFGSPGEIYGNDADDSLSTPNEVTRNDSSSPVEENCHIDEETSRENEEARVLNLIKNAEESASFSPNHTRRAKKIFQGSSQKDTTISLIQVIDTFFLDIERELSDLQASLEMPAAKHAYKAEDSSSLMDVSPEERLSLTISKSDFRQMHISGQFNLGFILATRENRDMFIIDQHASDEKYNFERLQATTVVQNQRLVQPHTLLLTAMEEEIIIENEEALVKNGFLVEVDKSGEQPVGRRCRLLSLPMSREVTFDVTDLEELLALLAESSPSNTYVPRPSKVRRMFAMRACRSSVMIGKTLTSKQMQALVKHMSEIDKPWNCPHGRPTMRHLCGLAHWEGWKEGDGLVGMLEDPLDVDWKGWLESVHGEQENPER